MVDVCRGVVRSFRGTEKHGEGGRKEVGGGRKGSRKVVEDPGRYGTQIGEERGSLG